MQKLPQPVKLWWYGPLLPPRAPPGRPLSPVHPARRRGDRLRLAARRRRADHAARRASARPRGPGPAAAARQPGLAGGARRLPRASSSAYLREHEDELAEDVRERIDENPLRAFDSKDEGTPRGDGRGARRCSSGSTPRTPSTSRPCATCSTRPGSPTSSTAPWSAGSTTTRARCSSSTASGWAPSPQVGGGGRYDGLIELLGGPADPGGGLGRGGRADPAGARRASEEAPPHDVFVAAADGQRERALALVTELRHAGLRAELDLADRGLKGQMRQADRLGAAHAVILEADGGASAPRHALRRAARGRRWRSVVEELARP